GLAIEKLLDLAQFGILRKYDAFEVVFDPGTDKVEKRCLGPIPTIGRDTGGSLVTTTQPPINIVAEHFQFIGLSSIGQFSRRRPGWGMVSIRFHQMVPIGERLGGRDPNRRSNNHTMDLLDFVEGENLLPATDP